MTDRQIIALAAVFGAIFHGFLGVWLGQDFNFDRLNYHEYLGWKAAAELPFLWHLPANFLQAWLNPWPYLPHHWLHSLLGDYGAQMTLGALQGSQAGLIAAMACRLLKPDQPYRLLLIAGTVFIGLTGPVLISEAGTSFVDGLLGLLILSGLALVVGRRPTPGMAFCAALLIGLSFGLKNTGIIFAVGLAALLSISGMAGWFSRISAAAVGGGIGWLITGGWHAVQLLNTFGNPAWPYFSLGGLGDPRFLPESFLEGLFYPLLIAGGAGPTSEIPLADPRWVLIVLPAILVGLGWLRGRDKLSLTSRQWLAFTIGVWLPWIALFGIERFIAPLEAVSGLIILALILDLGHKKQLTLALCAVAFTVIATGTRVPDLRRGDWQQAGLAVDASLVPVNTAILLAPGRFSYVIPALPAQSRVLALGPTAAAAGLDMVKLVAAQSGGAYLLNDGSAPNRAVRFYLWQLGLTPTDDCQSVTSRIDRLRLCKLARLAPDAWQQAYRDWRGLNMSADGLRFDLSQFRDRPNGNSFTLPIEFFHDYDNRIEPEHGQITIGDLDDCPMFSYVNFSLNGVILAHDLQPHQPTQFDIPSDMLDLESEKAYRIKLIDRRLGDRHRFDGEHCGPITVTDFIFKSQTPKVESVVPEQIP